VTSAPRFLEVLPRAWETPWSIPKCAPWGVTAVTCCFIFPFGGCHIINILPLSFGGHLIRSLNPGNENLYILSFRARLVTRWSCKCSLRLLCRISAWNFSMMN